MGKKIIVEMIVFDLDNKKIEMIIEKEKTRYSPGWEDPRLCPQLLERIQPVITGSSNMFYY